MLFSRHGPSRRDLSRLQALSLLALVLACGRDARDEVPPVQAPPVAVAGVSVLDLAERIEATGELQAPLHTEVAAEVGGRITEIRVGEGESVAAGTVVLEIDPQRRELEVERAAAGLAQAEAALRKERRQTERVRELGRSSVASKSRLDEAELALQVAESNYAAQHAQLELARQALADASVRAPFAGVMGERRVSIGQSVQPGTPLFELVCLDPIEVVFRVAELDSGRVQPGQHVDVRVAPWPDERFEAVVDVVYPTIDPASRTLRVKATVANPAGRLRPGLFARADLGVAVRKGVVMVPEEAVLQRMDGAVVFLLDASGEDGPRVRRRVVRLGDFHEGLVEVRGPVAPGDRVVIRGHADLVDGAVVRLEDRAASVAAGGIARP